MIARYTKAPISVVSCWCLSWFVARHYVDDAQTSFHISVLVMLVFNEINTCALRLADIADVLVKRKK